MTLNTYDGIKVYTPISLKLYDWWVLSISNNYAWRCNTEAHLLPHFRENIGDNHLDIGVGTGFYLKKSLDKIKKVSLVDFNAYSLNYARKYIQDDKLNLCINHDVFKIFPNELRTSFDSISIFYLLHCLPGTIDVKKQAIENICDLLTNSGVLYGATILGENIEHNAFGKKLMSIYNKKGIFTNYSDSEDSLENMLSSLFQNVSIRVQGAVALFSAKDKIISK